MDFEPAENEVWDCEGCNARAAPRFFNEVEGRDDAMRCPDCGELAYQVTGVFKF